VIPPPDDLTLERFLDQNAPFTPVPLCPELFAFAAVSLVAVWEAAEALAGGTMPSPFWAFPWPAGIALARVVLDRPDLVRDRFVLDLGAGGGVASFACARAGAAGVVACDVDPWAVAVTRIAARRQRLDVETLGEDPTLVPPALDTFDVVLAADLAYDRRSSARERATLQRAAMRGATVLLADAGRTYFKSEGMELLAEMEIPVVQDLEGVDTRVTRVYRWTRK
jgi:predicted nicotinamide N-methyase